MRHTHCTVLAHFVRLYSLSHYDFHKVRVHFKKCITLFLFVIEIIRKNLIKFHVSSFKYSY